MVRGVGRVDNERTGVTQIGVVREEFQGIEEAVYLGLVTLVSERKDAADTFGQVFLGEGTIRAVRQLGMRYPSYARMAGKVLRHGEG
jgi:hypothetical protein